MDVREQMKVAILKQEQMFRRQVHELHRLYHVQKQLMQQTQQPAASSYAPAITDVKPKPGSFQIIHRKKPIHPQPLFSLPSATTAPAPAPAEDCSLELTLATGPSSSSSCGNGGNAGRHQAKRLKTSSNSDSGTTAASSTSTESELALFGEVGVARTAARRMDEIGQGAWMYQCLSLKTA